MSKFLHGLIHVVAAAAQVANLATGIVPGPYKAIVAAAIALAQAGVALYNHGGTSVQAQ